MSDPITNEPASGAGAPPSPTGGTKFSRFLKTNKDVLLASAFALIIGFGIGVANIPEPVVVTESVTKTVEVTATPESCVNALAAAEALDGKFQATVGLLGEYIKADRAGNVSLSTQKVIEISGKAEELTDARDLYEGFAVTCRSN
jgi:hypothetical protein